ncbi:MAG TPA: ABC transporter ATP-binding protein [Trebonia sp.]|nr:ABC transporter ATP-binding protein [Trebonia sp.]
MTLLTISQVTKTYRGARGRQVTALLDVSLEIDDHQVVALVGPSGCGKSTLLRMIAGLDAGYTGRIEWTVPPKPGKDIGYVFQDPALLPWRSVTSNVTLGLDGKGVPKAEMRERARELLALVGLQDFGDAYPGELSGGMQQRVAIVRALAYDPRVLLMDEPFGALDAITRDRLQDDLLRIWEQTHKTIVLVTHSVEEATYLADRVVVLTPQPGSVRSVFDVPLSRDRDGSVRQLPQFAEFAGVLREHLA